MKLRGMWALVLALTVVLPGVSLAQQSRDGRVPSNGQPPDFWPHGGWDAAATATRTAAYGPNGEAYFAPWEPEYLKDRFIQIWSSKTVTTGAVDSMLVPTYVKDAREIRLLLKFRAASSGAGLTVSFRGHNSAVMDSAATWTIPYGGAERLGKTFVYSPGNNTASWTAVRESLAVGGFGSGAPVRAPYLSAWVKNVALFSATFDLWLWITP